MQKIIMNCLTGFKCSLVQICMDFVYTCNEDNYVFIGHDVLHVLLSQ